MKGNIFIKRPVAALSIAIAILFVGAISFFSLPMESYPDIAPPTVMVSATYTGASAEAVTKAVIQPLEESINGVENMLYMTSTSTNAGSASITVYFKQGTDADMATVNVQNRVSQAQGLLPSEVTSIGVTTVKRQTSFLQIDALVSHKEEFDQDFVSNYLDINVEPQLARVEGVGEVFVLGGTYSMRIWMKPDVMAQYNLVPSDITAVLAEQNLEASTGNLGEKPLSGNKGADVENAFQYTLKYTGRLQSAEEFENIVILANDDGTVLRLKDVADVELGSQSYSYFGEVNGETGVQFMCFQLAGANAKETNDRVSATLEELSKDLPEGLEFVQLECSNDFLLASIANVEETLIIAIILVVLVVYYFLQDFRATLIPSISIIISLVGTFAALQVAGFSLNLLTLFALVLAIGTVVDDAIVVVEAVQAKFDAGYTSPYLATRDAMNDVTMAIISTTLVFMAVFIPVTFMGGTSGVFYTQFGVTLAVAVAISTVSALVVCPALAAMMMRPAGEGRRRGFWGSINYYAKIAYNASYTAMLHKYSALLQRLVGRKYRYVASFGFLFLAIVGMIYFASALPQSLVPQEDQGVVMMNVSGVPGNNVASTEKVLKKAEAIVKDVDEVKNYSKTAGYGFMSGQGTSYGMMIIQLKDWDDRYYGMFHPIKNMMSTSTMVANAQLNARLGKEIPEASCFVFEPGMIPGYGMGSTELNLQDKTAAADKDLFYNYTQEFLQKLNQRPEVASAITTYARNFPQYQVEVDAAQCKRAGVSPSDVLSALGSYLGGSYVSNMNQFSKVYRVYIQAAPEYRATEEQLSNMFVRSGSSMAPLSQFVKLTKVEGPEIDKRFNLFSSITVNVTANSGVGTSELMAAIEETKNEVFPDGYSYEYGGMAREEAQQIDSIDTYLIYAVSTLLIFLILSVLYESFLVPWAVIFSVPAGLMGAFGFAWLWNRCYDALPFIFMGQIENNIYLQTAVIMLIGLLGKTAILITEFALERRRKGMGIVESAYAAAETRLRPILMTVLTMIFGMLPLVFSHGAGSNGNRTIGIGVIGGMVIGTIAILITVPLFFIIFEYLQECIRPPMEVEVDQQVLIDKERARKEREEREAKKNK